MIDERVAQHLREMDIKVAVVGGFDKRATFAQIREIAVLYESILQEKEEIIRRYESTSGFLPDADVSARIVELEEALRRDKAQIEQLMLEKRQLEEALALQKQEISQLYLTLQGQQQQFAPVQMPNFGSVPSDVSVVNATQNTIPTAVQTTIPTAVPTAAQTAATYPQNVSQSMSQGLDFGLPPSHSAGQFAAVIADQATHQTMQATPVLSQMPHPLQQVEPDLTSTFEPADALPVGFQGGTASEVSPAFGAASPIRSAEATESTAVFSSDGSRGAVGSQDYSQIVIAQPSLGGHSDVAVMSEAARQAQRQDYVEQLSQMEKEYQALLQQRIAEEQRSQSPEFNSNSSQVVAGQVGAASQPLPDSAQGVPSAVFENHNLSHQAIPASQFMPQAEPVSQPLGLEQAGQVCAEPAVKSSPQISQEATHYQALLQSHQENQGAFGSSISEASGSATQGFPLTENTSVPMAAPATESAILVNQEPATAPELSASSSGTSALRNANPSFAAPAQRSDASQESEDASQRASVEAHAQRIAQEKDKMMKDLDSARQRLMEVRNRLS